MAKGDNEGRMLFDIRGRRRNVIKVVYAILALLMGLSLILLAGPGIGGLGGDGGNPAEASEERAERLEARLEEEPGNANVLLNLTRTQIAVANALSDVNAVGQAVPTVASRQELQKASSTWEEYLEATDQPSASGAQLVSSALFSLAESSRSSVEGRRNVTAAAEAQQILADQRPSLGALSTLSFYLLYAGDFKGGEEALAEAKKFANSKFERQQLQNQFDQIEEAARGFERQLKEAEKAAEEGAPAGGGSGGLENPFGTGGSTSE